MQLFHQIYLWNVYLESSVQGLPLKSRRKLKAPVHHPHVRVNGIDIHSRSIRLSPSPIIIFPLFLQVTRAIHHAGQAVRRTTWAGS